MDICKHNEFCGGCTFQGMPYEEQLRTKQSEVKALFREKGIEPLEFDEIEGCPSQYRYRNKMEYTFGNFEKGGELELGMHKKKNFMSVINVEECQIVNEDFNKILAYTLDFAKKRDYAFFHKRMHTGTMKNLIVRQGVRTGELLVNIIMADFPEFDADAYRDGLLELKLENKIVGILKTIDNGVADAVKPEKVELLWGRDYYMEKIMGLDFKVSAFSFFQTNVEAIERLYSEALGLIDSFEGKNVYDLYCGTGTITQVLASKAKSVTGIEIVQEAVEAARENAKLNELDNCKFIAGDVFETLKNLDGDPETEKPDVIVVDPPRVGMSKGAIDKIVSYGVNQIVYISCGPKTLASNLEQFEDCGYKVEYAKAFDNFPMTKHVETVVLISKK